jgi:hypothetical protein
VGDSKSSGPTTLPPRSRLLIGGDAAQTTGGGLNGSSVLTASTITEAAQSNMPTSGTGQTWFIVHARDKVANRKATDVETVVP